MGYRLPLDVKEFLRNGAKTVVGDDDWRLRQKSTARLAEIVTLELPDQALGIGLFVSSHYIFPIMAYVLWVIGILDEGEKIIYCKTLGSPSITK